MANPTVSQLSLAFDSPTEPAPSPQPIPTYKRFRDLTGQVFGRLTVLYYVGMRPYANTRTAPFWWCRCECGLETTINGHFLVSKLSKSCGCWWREAHYTNTLTHGSSIGRNPTPEYKTWNRMRKRCLNPSPDDYALYMGRGITICKQWDSFKCFLEDMGTRPSEKHSLDRIDVNSGYSKSNCRWATAVEQARNKRNNHILTFNGKSQCVAAWSEETGLPRYTIQKRISRGWSEEEALTTPHRSNRTRKTSSSS